MHISIQKSSLQGSQSSLSPAQGRGLSHPRPFLEDRGGLFLSQMVIFAFSPLIWGVSKVLPFAAAADHGVQLVSLTTDGIVPSCAEVEASHKEILAILDSNEHPQTDAKLAHLAHRMVRNAGNTFDLVKKAYCFMVDEEAEVESKLLPLYELTTNMIRGYRRLGRAWPTTLVATEPVLYLKFQHALFLVDLCVGILRDYLRGPFEDFYTDGEKLEILHTLEIAKLRLMKRASYFGVLSGALPTGQRGEEIQWNLDIIKDEMEEALQQTSDLYWSFSQKTNDLLPQFDSWFPETLRQVHRILFNGPGRVLTWITSSERAMLPAQQALASLIASDLVGKFLDLAKESFARLKIPPDYSMHSLCQPLPC